MSLVTWNGNCFIPHWKTGFMWLNNFYHRRFVLIPFPLINLQLRGSERGLLVLKLAINSPSRLMNHANWSSFMWISDGFFFQFQDIAECCERLANMGKIVIVAALDGDYSRRVLFSFSYFNFSTFSYFHLVNYLQRFFLYSCSSKTAQLNKEINSSLLGIFLYLPTCFLV